MTKRVFITGASGCVGHYLVEDLIRQTDYELYLLVRNPDKMKHDITTRPGIHLVQGSLQEIAQHRELLSTMHAVVSTAAAWGGEAETQEINVQRTVELFSLLNPEVCDRAIYFSTASILDEHNQLLDEAERIGTDYIRSKHACLQKLEASSIRERLIAVFPTLVFGGSDRTPRSFLSAGLHQVVRYLPLIRFLKADGSFHYIHAADIAQVLTHLLVADRQDLGAFPARLVLGMPRLTVNQAIADACSFFHKSIGWQIDLSPALVNSIVKLFNIKVAAWDYFCMAQRHFTYDVVNPETFGKTSRYPHIADLMAEL